MVWIWHTDLAEALPLQLVCEAIMTQDGMGERGA
jgi:hypothetical protein